MFEDHQVVQTVDGSSYDPSSPRIQPGKRKEARKRVKKKENVGGFPHEFRRVADVGTEEQKGYSTAKNRSPPLATANYSLVFGHLHLELRNGTSGIQALRTGLGTVEAVRS